MMTLDNKMVFNEIIVYVFMGLFGVSTALVGWVAVQTVEQIRISTAIQEHDKSMDSMMSSNAIELREQSQKINDIRLEMAQHGWGSK
jgi:hypothetical protein